MDSKMMVELMRQGILSKVWKHKLLFVETPDAMETSIALKNFREVRLVSTQLKQAIY